MSDSDPILTGVFASIQNAAARLLPKGFVCVIIVGRSGTTKLRVAKNCDEATMINMLESAKGATEENAIDLKRAAQ